MRACVRAYAYVSTADNGHCSQQASQHALGASEAGSRGEENEPKTLVWLGRFSMWRHDQYCKHNILTTEKKREKKTAHRSFENMVADAVMVSDWGVLTAMFLYRCSQSVGLA